MKVPTKMKNLFGKRVKILRSLTRVTGESTDSGTKYYAYYKSMHRNTEGLVTGYRLLSDGVVHMTSNGEPSVYIADNRYWVLTVVLNPRVNPIYVALRDVEELA